MTCHEDIMGGYRCQRTAYFLFWTPLLGPTSLPKRIFSVEKLFLVIFELLTMYLEITTVYKAPTVPPIDLQSTPTDEMRVSGD